ncbi:acyl-CoA dehydrogenase [Prauserella sp. PE36]|uniref:acyl-CoA dehydrogenase family protein n=1 Tax=Prauserella sp. PE36 TaxID=1504709 RepID=UPI000DE2FE8F|nr:acyl-CoA dehydrogenase family protein [Prauserella sp. PE36]RBM18839.1 acyl-CoA dehydrogenase [Prauserella sp. PE36]
MRFALSDEQTELQQTMRAILGARAPVSSVAEVTSREPWHDRRLWLDLASGIGIQGLLIPEEYGGLGAGVVEVAAVMEAMGSVLLPSPYLSTSVLSAMLLARGSDEEIKKRYLPRLVDGTVLSCLAWQESAHGWDPLAVETRAVDVDGVPQLHGRKSYVVDGATADLIIVSAVANGSLGLYLVDVAAPGLTCTVTRGLDATRNLATIEFDGVPCRSIPLADAAETLVRILAVGTIALAAEQVGAASASLETSVSYARTRTAFGRPIGSFQAIKHLCSDNFIEVEAARAAVYNAAWTADHDVDRLVEVASLCKASASDALYRAAADNIQIHGGIGFTWEHAAHLYFRRARSSMALLGTPSHHREVLASLLAQ